MRFCLCFYLKIYKQRAFQNIQGNKRSIVTFMMPLLLSSQLCQQKIRNRNPFINNPPPFRHDSGDLSGLIGRFLEGGGFQMTTYNTQGKGELKSNIPFKHPLTVTRVATTAPRLFRWSSTSCHRRPFLPCQISKQT